MAYTVIKCEVGGSTSQGYYYEYLCESADDVANLPTGADSADITRPAPGSLALIEGDLSIYMLTINREWSEVMSGSGGGGGGGTGSGVLAITGTIDGQNVVLDKTWQQIFDHCASGGLAVVYQVVGTDLAQTMPVSTVQDEGGGTYYVYSYLTMDDPEPTKVLVFDTDSPDGYPSMALGG